MTAQPRFDEVLQQVFILASEHTEVSKETLTADTQMLSDLSIDSVQNAEMVCDLEDHFEVTLSLQVLQRSVTLGDVANAVAGALPPQAGA
jgi:acyl carrier protein